MIEETNEDSPPRWNFKKANWEKFGTLCEERLQIKIFVNEVNEETKKKNLSCPFQTLFSKYLKDVLH